jgi:hypothetical protein
VSLLLILRESSSQAGLEALALDALYTSLSPRNSAAAGGTSDLSGPDPAPCRAVEPFSLRTGDGQAATGAEVLLQLQLEGSLWSRPFGLGGAADGSEDRTVCVRRREPTRHTGVKTHRYVEASPRE